MSRRAALVAASVALAASAMPASASGEAVTVQADVQHTGHVERGGPAPPLRLSWQARLRPWVGYPVVAGNRVFVVTREPFTDAFDLVALSLRTGRRLWTKDLQAPERVFAASLAYDAGRLFVLRDIYPQAEHGGLLAVSPEDGRTLWQTTALSAFLAIPPVADGGAVYVAQPPEAGGGASAWSQADGSLLWTARFDYATAGPLALSDDRVYAGLTCDGRLARLSRADGAPIQPFATQCGLSGGPHAGNVLSGDRVFVHGDWDGDGLYDTETTERVERMRSLQSPAIAGDVIVTSVGAYREVPDAPPYALQARTAGGRALWRFAGDRYLDSKPLIVGRTVYVGSGSGRIYALNLRSGRVRWRTRAPRAVLGEPGPLETGLAAAGGALLVPTYGALRAYRSAG